MATKKIPSKCRLFCQGENGHLLQFWRSPSGSITLVPPPIVGISTGNYKLPLQREVFDKMCAAIAAKGQNPLQGYNTLYTAEDATLSIGYNANREGLTFTASWERPAQKIESFTSKVFDWKDLADLVRMGSVFSLQEQQALDHPVFGL